MKSIKTTPEFMNLTEDEIVAALDDFENQFATEDDVDSDIEPENPIVKEVARLINEYTNRFDEIFMDAVHDSMQEADDFE